jgi:hypothetical protein
MFERISGPMPAQITILAAPPTGTQLPSRAVAAASGNTSPDAGRGSPGRDSTATGTGLTGTPGDTFRMAAFLSSLADPDAPTGPQPTFERTYLEAVAERRRSEARAGRDDTAPAPTEPARGPRTPLPGQAPGETPQTAAPAPLPEPVSRAGAAIAPVQDKSTAPATVDGTVRKAPTSTSAAAQSALNILR